MLKKEEQFILMDIAAFGEWISKQSIQREITRVQNHHTWKPDYASFKGDNHFRLLKGMKASHLKRSFSDIAQNITTFPDGIVAVCRSFEKAPAGIYGANKGTLCIEHIGNFDHGGDQMNEQHKETILLLNAILCDKFDLYPNTDVLIYHHWFDLKTGKRKNGEGVVKTCPGTNFFGGNKVHDAETHFIPQVVRYFEQIDERLCEPEEIGQLKEGEIRKFPIEEHSEIKKNIIFHPKSKKRKTVKNKYAEIRVRKLNVRRGPDVKYGVKRYLLHGELVPILESGGGWLRISENEWIFDKHVKVRDLAMC